ncbi:unnamed protein product [Ranitomeya imitator]|uniref:Ferredoxin n=1 Tax=Ranitomeya imitator TaxID=111125 RepID=A0ABN9LA09_9NEOB|nr:unnamed protein product [Ranitomeya imitator]
MHIVEMQKRRSSEDKVTVKFVNRDGEAIVAEGKIGESLLDLVVEKNLDIDGFGAEAGGSRARLGGLRKRDRDALLTPERTRSVGKRFLDPGANGRYRLGQLQFLVFYLFTPVLVRGRWACSTCHLIFEDHIFQQLDPVTDEEMDMLDLAYGLTDTSRLGCQICLRPFMNWMTVKVPEAVADVRQAVDMGKSS